MPRIIGATLMVAALATALGAGVVLKTAPTPPPDIAKAGKPQRGAYLARAGGCIACHTDTKGGGKPLAGGAPLDTPFGRFVPPNITPDPQHGIGNWSRGEFARALRQGVAPDGTPYYPAFPHAYYAGLGDTDIADLWAAFQTVAPVSAPAPASDIAFPFNQRWGLWLWRAVFRQPARNAPAPDRSDTWNRGKWLVEGVAHCGACHTARNALGGRSLPDGHFAGSDALPGGDSAPAITPGALRENDWTASSLAAALSTGLMPDGDVFGGAMAEVVNQGTTWLSPADRRAMAAYLLNADPPDPKD
ncbi:c-type cytochrome [Sediminimonas qiaohouensis]|uniref:c-type cytochrome n=1 Tax=Sediminimonas qiaohouensis TaxID=552061 RepID=UPI00047884A2|nr:cytochrome c [Sediminimonas qiaohouensis]